MAEKRTVEVIRHGIDADGYEHVTYKIPGAIDTPEMRRALARSMRRSAMAIGNVTRLYCRGCGYVHWRDGVGTTICPTCGRGMWFTTGTPEEVQEFVDAMEKDPEAYRRFPGGDRAY